MVNQKKILVTGCAGFIGYHLCKSLNSKEYQVIGIDNLNDYYDVSLKISRLKNINNQANFKFYKIDIKDRNQLNELFLKNQFDLVVNLAAQAGVRYSLTNPFTYIDNNITGFLNILEQLKNSNKTKLIYASSSSIYGLNKKTPFSESDFVDYPISVYAATKKTNELFAHSYSSLYDIKTTGLRFFTVYGEWGRPDMAAFIFTKNIIEGKPINLFNNGNLKRDFTYVADIIRGIRGIMKKELSNTNGAEEKKYRIFNIGNNSPVELIRFVNIIEDELKLKAKIELSPMQVGDVYETYADISSLNDYIGYTPQTTIETGLHKFICWYKEYYLSVPSVKISNREKSKIVFDKIDL